MAAPARPQAPAGDFHSVAFYAHKGGVGKSTLIFDAAYRLATKFSTNVVIIDADSQLNTSFKLLHRGGERDANLVTEELVNDFLTNSVVTVGGRPRRTLLNFLTVPDARLADDDLIPIANCNNKVFLLLGSPQLHTAERDIMEGMQPHASNFVKPVPMAFRNLLKMINEHQAFNLRGRVSKPIILVDMSPNSNLMNQNILLSCDYLVLPCNPDDNSLMSLKLLLHYIRRWRIDDLHSVYLQHHVKLIFAVMNRYKIGNHGIQNKSGTKMSEKYIKRASDEIDTFIAQPGHAAFLVQGAHNRFLKVQNGMGQSEAVSENFLSMYELKTFKVGPEGHKDDDKIDSFCAQLDLIVDEIRSQILGIAPVAPVDSDAESQMDE